MTKYEKRAKENWSSFPIEITKKPKKINKYGIGVYDDSPISNDTNLSAFPSDKKIFEMRCSTMAYAHWFRYMHSVKLVKNGNSVLDLGSGKCYIGRFLYQALKKPVYVAMDLDKKRLRDGINMGFGYEKYLFMARDITRKLPFNDKTFDVIFSYESLEHVNQKLGKKMLKEIYRVLKKGGLFSVATPNFQGLKVVEKYSRYKASGKGDFKEHPYEWNFTELFKYLRSLDFTIVNTFGNDIVESIKSVDKNFYKIYREPTIYESQRDFFPSSIVRALYALNAPPDEASFITIDARK